MQIYCLDPIVLHVFLVMAQGEVRLFTRRALDPLSFRHLLQNPQHDISLSFPHQGPRHRLPPVVTRTPPHTQKKHSPGPLTGEGGPSRPFCTYSPCRVLTGWGLPYLQGAHVEPVYPKTIFVTGAPVATEADVKLWWGRQLDGPRKGCVVSRACTGLPCRPSLGSHPPSRATKPSVLWQGGLGLLGSNGSRLKEVWGNHAIDH